MGRSVCDAGELRVLQTHLCLNCWVPHVYTALQILELCSSFCRDSWDWGQVYLDRRRFVIGTWVFNSRVQNGPVLSSPGEARKLPQESVWVLWAGTGTALGSVGNLCPIQVRCIKLWLLGIV